jgi:hypothetical protein
MRKIALTTLLLSLLIAPLASARPQALNPCQLSAAGVPFAFGTKVTGKLTVQPQANVKAQICTYTKGAVKLTVTLAPKSLYGGGFGGGGKIMKDPDLGPKGVEAWSTGTPTYADVIFTKGAYYGSVWSNKLPINKVLLVAKLYYSAIR